MSLQIPPPLMSNTSNEGPEMNISTIKPGFRLRGILYEENGIQVEAKDGLEEMGFV